MQQPSKPIRLAPWCAALAVFACWTAAGEDAPGSAPAAAPSGDFRGYSGIHWPSDFQIRSGHCDRERITESPRRSDAVASLGQRRSLNRTAALLVGARIPDLLPSNLGAELDEGDRACIGQVLELGASGHWVKWDNGATGVHYAIRPEPGRNGIAGSCREFRIRASGNYEHAKLTAKACESGPGLWQLTDL
jgi:hypothetical protein